MSQKRSGCCQLPGRNVACPTPALLTRMSIAPKRPRACPTMSEIAASRLRSASIVSKLASLPCSRAPLASALSPARVRSTAATRMPASSSPFTKARPIPPAAPVTIAVRCVSLIASPLLITVAPHCHCGCGGAICRAALVSPVEDKGDANAAGAGNRGGRRRSDPEQGVRQGARAVRRRVEHDESHGALPADPARREGARRVDSKIRAIAEGARAARLAACRRDQRLPVLNRHQFPPCEGRRWRRRAVGGGGELARQRALQRG